MQCFAQVLRTRSVGASRADRMSTTRRPRHSSRTAGRRGYPDYKAGVSPAHRDWTWSGIPCGASSTDGERKPRGDWVLDETLPGRRQTASQIAASTTGARRSGVYRRATPGLLAAFQARPFVMLKAA